MTFMKSKIRELASSLLFWDLTTDDVDKKLERKERLEYFTLIGLNVKDNRRTLEMFRSAANATRIEYQKHRALNGAVGDDEVIKKLRKIEDIDIRLPASDVIIYIQPAHIYFTKETIKCQPSLSTSKPNA